MDNANVAQASNFLFVMTNETRHLQFFVQEFSGLGMTFTEVDNQTYFGQRIKRPGDVLSFNDITLTILVDEDMKILDETYNFLAKEIKNVSSNELNWNNIFTGILHLSTNRNNLQKVITFENCWIKEMGDLQFTSTQAEVSPIITTATISFDSYSIA